MPDSLLAWSKELVVVSTRANRLSPDEAIAMLFTTHATLRRLQQQDSGQAPPATELLAEPRQQWEETITQHDIVCLACGSSFRHLTTRHLRVHDLAPQSYRIKYGIPGDKPLSLLSKRVF